MHLVNRIKYAALLLGCTGTFSTHSFALDISGITLPDVEQVAQQNLVLSGAGIRTKLIFKVYAAGLYLSGKKSSAQSVLAAPGAKRITVVMLRDIDRKTFKKAFVDGMEMNSSKAELAQVHDQFLKFSAVFDSIAALKKGDRLTTDWRPASGVLVQLNGKTIADISADEKFFHVILKIWLGNNPADPQLKKSLLGAAE